MAQDPWRRPSATPPSSPLPASPAGRRNRSGKISGNLLGLSTAAILAVYAAGYAATRSDAAGSTDATAASLPAASASTPVLMPTPTPFAPGGDDRRGGRDGRGSGLPGQAPTPAPTTAPSSSTAASYKDGTYTGSGNSRHGGMTVSVVVQGGKIVSARVSQCGTRYSCAYVNPLTAEVVSRQGPPVDYVSGATDSSTAYRQAVTAAIARATQA